MMQLGIWEISRENSLSRRYYRRIHKTWHEVTSQKSSHVDEPDFICLLGYPGRTVVYDVVLPIALRKNTEREVLLGELSARLPVPLESVYWFYQICGNGRYRICAVHREEMDRLLECAQAHSLKFDMAIPAEFAHSPEEILRVVSGDHFAEHFRPIRCQGLKTLCLFLLAATIILSGITVLLRYQDFAQEHKRLTTISSSWEKLLHEERQQFAELSADNELLQELRSAKIDTPPVSPVLTQLTAALPKTMWVTNYSQNYDFADITLSASKDESGLYNQIGETENYTIVNLRKNRGYNDTISFSIKLKLKH